MGTVDDAFRANENIIAGLADVHDGILWMPIASTLKIIIKGFT
jgi:predicted transcriptional regulator